ncbi:acyl-CoA synthetases/AMP-acid ligases II [Lophiotrema nucula]|uniref:Acyl-CoA synthetases/AMP-acid ligases II n=1 Tax=Lophiotrema nucula TaxID=690887 RepID=A0A6A5YT39_9PLEO|nr:acyl-CoA synthetases/AMP-acid ligases II [Lophiotrema nucula]
MTSQRIYRSPYPAPYVPTNLSISQLLELGNPDDVEAGKIIFEDDWTSRKLSFAGIREQSAKGAFGLRHVLGVKEGDSVFICAPNCVDVVNLIHTVLWCGGTAVLVSPLSTEYELSHYLDISQPQIIAADASTWTTVAGALRRKGSSQLKSISVDDTESPLGNAIPFSTIFKQEISLPAFDLSTRDSRQHTACVCFSSGTSGKPKGVELSHYNLVASMLGIRATEAAYNNGNIRGVFFAPLCHIYGLMVVALLGSWLGYYTMTMKKFTLNSYLELSAKTEATALRILPTIAVGISKQTTFDLTRLRHVKFIMCSGAVLPMPTIEFFRRQFPQAPIMQGYGMTEGNVTMLKPESAHRVGSVGRLFANVEARVIDEGGKDVAEGEQGEMLVRGPSTFRRYMRNELATRETFDGEWMRTGDVVRVDKDGFWFLTERKKEMIKYKGNQVAPAELESILNSHPGVSEGAVCALWDENQGTEIPIAYVTLTPAAKSSSMDRESLLLDIRRHVDEKVAPYKKLRGGVVVLDELPKSATGKVLRRMLPARLARERKAKL